MQKETEIIENQEPEKESQEETQEETQQNVSKKILEELGIDIEKIENHEIDRDFFLDMHKYDAIQKYIVSLKKEFSSSFLTSLQENARIKQKFPLLNLVRQILNVYGYKMEPLRKCDGYTLDKKKRFKRYFLIVKEETI
jgi:hypothetical protein